MRAVVTASLKGKHLEVNLNASLFFSQACSPQLCIHTPLGISELFWASTSSAFHIRLCVNYDASVKMSLLTVCAWRMEGGIKATPITGH